MARKSNHRTSGVDPATGLPWRFRVPRELRVVTATRVRTGTRNPFVPQIRLRGDWLAQLGFKRGATFLVLADTPKQITLTIL